MPVVAHWAYEHLNPYFLVCVFKLGECAGNTGERVDFKALERFNRQKLSIG